MSINQTDTIDIISTSPDGKVILTISDQYSWEETRHLQMLQDKINAYLKFIESGQVIDSYPHAGGRETRIEAVFKFEPTNETTSFLEKAKSVITGAEISFQWRVLNFDEQHGSHTNSA
jgi:hypothetical protein